jgi:hypothetical protein
MHAAAIQNICSGHTIHRIAENVKHKLSDFGETIADLLPLRNDEQQ